MKRPAPARSSWQRYLRPPPPVPRDARIFTWALSVGGALFLVTVLTVLWATDPGRKPAPRGAGADSGAGSRAR